MVGSIKEKVTLHLENNSDFFALKIEFASVDRINLHFK